MEIYKKGNSIHCWVRIKRVWHAACHHIILFIIDQTHYEKSDWSRAFNQFTIACELDMINAISAACQVQRLPGY